MTPASPIPVCGIATSVDDHKTLQQFFDALPCDLGLAYLVVLSDRPGERPPSILHLSMPTTVVRPGEFDSLRLTPDTIVVLAPGCDVDLDDGEMTRTSSARPHTHGDTLDRFLHTLAAYRHDRLAVLLSGFGRDGVLGAKAVKDSGGLVLVQEPQEATHDALPRAVIASGSADIVLPVRELASRLAELMRGKPRPHRARHMVDAAAEADLEHIATADDVAMLILDRELRIRHFTTRLAGMFDLEDRDLDRPIGELVGTLHETGLEHEAPKMLGHVAATGKAAHFEYFAAATGSYFDVCAFRIGTPEHRQVAVLFQDISGRKRRERNVAFLADVSMELVRPTNAADAMNAVIAKLGAHFNASRCQFSDVSTDETVTIVCDWTSSTEPHALASVRSGDVHRLHVRPADGRADTTVIRDTTQDPGTDSAKLAALSVSSLVSVPVVRDGRWRFNVCVVHNAPRDWTDDETDLLRDLTTRIFAKLETARADDALRESEARQAFLVHLTDQLRPLADPVEIMAVASEALGRHLAVDRSGYGEIDEAGEFITFSRDYCTPGVSSLVGRQPLEAFGKEIIDVQRAGRTLVITDARADLRLIGPDVARVFSTAQIVAGIAVPLIKRGRYVAALFVHQSTKARAWTPSEVTLTEEVAERTWAAVERARAEGALRQAHAELEQRVLQRTADLAAAITSLQIENNERRAAQAQNRALFQRILKVQEEERLRLARDLHDQLGQQMTALRMNLEALVQGTKHDAGLIAQTRRVQRLAEELDETVDFLTWDMRPAALAQLGLAAALEALVSGWSERFGIPAEFDAGDTESVRLRDDVEANVYRLAQEALHNVVKHAQATRIVASLHRRDEQLVFILEDDGCGFNVTDASKTAGESGLGLMSMRERAAMVGGTLDIESEVGHGTTIFVRIPITATEAAS